MTDSQTYLSSKNFETCLKHSIFDFASVTAYINKLEFQINAIKLVFQDPASSIPKGTMLSLLISMISYAVFVLLAGAAAMRDASGSIADLANGTLTDCSDSSSCQYGLFNSYSVSKHMWNSNDLFGRMKRFNTNNYLESYVIVSPKKTKSKIQIFPVLRLISGITFSHSKDFAHFL